METSPHSCVADGSLVKSDGTLLSALDREANDLADKWAKTAATGRRVAEDVRALLLDEADEVTDMARWIAMVTVRANDFDLGDCTFMRDFQAEKGCRTAGRRGRKRKVERLLPPNPTERLSKMPRLADLRQRVLAKAAARVSSALLEVG